MHALHLSGPRLRQMVPRFNTSNRVPVPASASAFASRKIPPLAPAPLVATRALRALDETRVIRPHFPIQSAAKCLNVSLGMRELSFAARFSVRR